MRNLQATSQDGTPYWLKADSEVYLKMLETDGDSVLQECWTDDQTKATAFDQHVIENTIARAALVMGAADPTMQSVELLNTD